MAKYRVEVACSDDREVIMHTKNEENGDSSSNEETLRDRGRRLARAAGDRVQTATGTLSGANIEQLVGEYSEQFTQVLLGLHSDVQAYGREVQQQSSRIAALEQELSGARKLRLAVLVSVTIALVSIGVAIWAAI